jgi:hypothetical protein
MHSSDFTQRSSNDSDWLAVRFVLGELNDDEVAAFEQQLANDQTARDALVQATRLVEAVARLPVPTPAVRPATYRIGRRSVVAATLTAAGICLALLGYNAFMPPEQNVLAERSSPSADPARLASLWIDAAHSLNGVPEIENDEPMADSQSALLPPDWLLAAVEEETAVPPDGPDFEPDSDAIERN